jgi:hypothetical protein
MPIHSLDLARRCRSVPTPTAWALSMVFAGCVAVAPVSALDTDAPSPPASEGEVCGATILQRDTANLTAVGDDVVRVELQRRAILRDGPDSDCTGATEVPAGATMQLLDCDDAWCLVAYGTDAGFVPAEFIERMPDRVPTLR